MLIKFFMVGMGGAIGAMMRLASNVIAVNVLGISVIFSTIFVNILGSMLIGAVMASFAHFKIAAGSPLPLFLVTGILGGFTTFSAFSLELMGLIETGRIFSALSYAVLSVGLGVFAAFIGYKMMGLVF